MQDTRTRHCKPAAEAHASKDYQFNAGLARPWWYRPWLHDSGDFCSFSRIRWTAQRRIRVICESFNGSKRDKLLNGEIFYTPAEARILDRRLETPQRRQAA